MRLLSIMRNATCIYTANSMSIKVKSKLVSLGVSLVDLLQVQGSIPLLWDQIVDLTYKPKFELVRLEEAVSFY